MIIIISGAVITLALTGLLYLLWPKSRKTTSRLVISAIFYKQVKIEGIIMAAQLNLNELLTGTLGIVNHATGEAITATFANVTATSSDTTVFTVTQNPDNSLTVDGIALGSGTLTVTTDATYTDPDPSVGLVTVSKSVTVTVTISPAQTATDLVVNFGTPVPQA